MPNWCTNKLEILTESKTFLAGLKQTLEHKAVDEDDRTGLLNYLCPQPSDLYYGPLDSKKEEELREQGIAHWYGWNTANWGTKWEARVWEFDVDEERAIVWFDTAWGPPLTAIEQLVELFEDEASEHDLTITHAFYEEGMDFYGLVQDGIPTYEGEYSDILNWGSEWCEFMGMDRAEELERKKEEYIEEILYQEDMGMTREKLESMSFETVQNLYMEL
jgi:hypothetical protein